MEFSHFLNAMFGGAVFFHGSAAALALTETVILQVWLRPYGRSHHHGLLARIKVAIFLSRFSRFLPFVHSVAGGIIVYSLVTHEGWEAVFSGLSFFAGFWVYPVFGKPAYSAKKLPQFSTQIAIKAVKQLVRYFPQPVQKSTLEWVSRFPDTRSKIAAINGLLESTDPWAMKELQFMAKDPDKDVRAAAKDAIELLQTVLAGKSPKSLTTMENLKKRYLELEKVAQAAPLQMAVNRRMLGDFGESIDAIVYTQVAYRTAFPDLYCKTCLSRAEEQSFKEWQWVRCKRCHDVTDLMIGIQRVIGEIGGTPKWLRQENYLRLNLWDQELKTVQRAEIDELRIVGGINIDYDWAISAVVQKIQNQVETREGQIKVKINGELHLAQNTKHLLRSLDPNVKLD